MENILKIFTSEDKDELRQAFKEIIKEQFQSQIEQMDVYLFDPSDIERMIERSFEEVINEVKLDFKEKMKEKMEPFMNKQVQKILNKIK